MLEMTIPSMTCGHCVGVVTKAIKQADPLATVDIDLARHSVRVQTTSERAAIESALTEAGYTPS